MRRIRTFPGIYLAYQPSPYEVYAADMEIVDVLKRSRLDTMYYKLLAKRNER